MARSPTPPKIHQTEASIATAGPLTFTGYKKLTTVNQLLIWLWTVLATASAEQRALQRSTRLLTSLTAQV